MLTVAAIAEALTGAALLVAPSVVCRLLLGEDAIGMAIPIARVAGMALIALGIACLLHPISGMLVYGAGVAILLGWLGLRGEASGILLWPPVVLHLVLTALMLRGLTTGKTWIVR